MIFKLRAPLPRQVIYLNTIVYSCKS